MSGLLTSIPKIQDADLQGKIVLVRVDHNVVKEGNIKDPFRVEITFGTMFNILGKGGKLILMSHVGRPKDKQTGEIKISDDTSVEPIVQYLNKRLHATFHTPEFEHSGGDGLKWEQSKIKPLMDDLRAGRIQGIYLPNTRWFRGEEDDGERAKKFARQLAELADVYVNDAFGSWQPHASTFGVTRHLPSYAGLLMQNEIKNLDNIFKPQRPLLAVVAGSKFDTKIGPLRALLEKSDHLMLGGVLYNAYLAARYDLQIKGLAGEDIEAARDFLQFSKRYEGKIIEPSVVVESDTLEGKIADRHRRIDIHEISAGDKQLNYILDVAPESFQGKRIKKIFGNAKSIFVNAVMGLTPHFSEGTISLFHAIGGNREAFKMLAGGDTLQELRILLPYQYMASVEDPRYYFFSGGGTILTAIEQGSAMELEPVKALIDSQGNGARLS